MSPGGSALRDSGASPAGHLSCPPATMCPSSTAAPCEAVPVPDGCTRLAYGVGPFSQLMPPGRQRRYRSKGRRRRFAHDPGLGRGFAIRAIADADQDARRVPARIAEGTEKNGIGASESATHRRTDDYGGAPKSSAGDKHAGWLHAARGRDAPQVIWDRRLLGVVDA